MEVVAVVATFLVIYIAIKLIGKIIRGTIRGITREVIRSIPPPQVNAEAPPQHDGGQETKNN